MAPCSTETYCDTPLQQEYLLKFIRISNGKEINMEINLTDKHTLDTIMDEMIEPVFNGIKRVLELQ